MTCTSPRALRNNIRYYRRRENLKLYEVSHLIGTSSPACVANWEKGRKAPNLDNTLRLSAVLKVPPEILFLPRLKQLREEISARRRLPIKKPL